MKLAVRQSGHGADCTGPGGLGDHKQDYKENRL